MSQNRPEARGRISAEDLRAACSERRVDTVVVAFPDMQGRMQGKRYAADFFINEVIKSGSEACNYLLSVNVEMEPQAGYAMSSWESGFGDFHLDPDLSTLRWVGWRERTVLCIADVVWPLGEAVEESPRAILKKQLARLAERGWIANAATELEFIVHKNSYEDAWHRNYHDLTPINRYNVDYSIFGQAEADPLIDEICRSMQDSGLILETAKGEANLGQHEINFKYSDPLTAADEHIIFKSGVKEIALKQGVSATFMAKWNEREGNSCHVHLSLADEHGQPVFSERPDVFDAFVAGQLAALSDFTLLYAPNINSYKRFASRSFAPTAVAWGEDNRSCALRVLGSGSARRYENRLAGADVNPYIALAANIAAGLHGIDNNLQLPPAEKSDAYAADHEHVPGSLEAARRRFLTSTIAREAFGEAVVEHYAHAAEIEITAFGTAITDWERKRGYERL